MNLTEQLQDGIKIDFKQQLSENVVNALSLLIDGNNLNKKDYSFCYAEHEWYYFTTNTGKFVKVKCGKYNYKEQDKLKDIKTEYQLDSFIYSELDYSDGDFYNIGNQIMFYETAEMAYIRVIPFGIDTSECMYLRTSNLAYYLVYDKILKKLDLYYQYDYNIEDASEEFEAAAFLNNHYDKYSNYLEDMELGFSYNLVEYSIKKLYDMIGFLEPTIQFKEIQDSYDIVMEMFDLLKKQKYKIFANEEAYKYISKFKQYQPETLIKMGFSPEHYKIEDCFKLSRTLDNVISLDDISYINKWDGLVAENKLGPYLEYYEDIKEIKIDISQIELFLKLLDGQETEIKDITRYVLRSVELEHLDLEKTLRDIILLYEQGEIKSWKGRFSLKLIRKNKMRSYTKLSESILDSLEKKPTLDNLYKKLGIA